MEQKLAIHKNQGHALTPSLSWNPPFALPSLWGPVSFEPLWGENDMFADMRRNMTQMFGGFLENWPTMGTQPYADVTEDRKGLRIKMDVPGLKAEDIDISTEDGMLVISADKQENANGAESRYSFSYSTRLPEGADIDHAVVSLANHRLSIEIPKGHGAAPKLAIGKAKHKPTKHKKARR